MKKLTFQHAKLLYCRFSAIYGDKFAKAHHDEQFKNVWAEEWAHGLQTVNVDLIKEALDHCRKNLEWPPSVCEFIKICEKISGIPSSSEALAALIRGDFNHPLIYLSYLKIGSWAIKNDKEEVLMRKYEKAYTEALNEFRSNPQNAYQRLEAHTKKPPELLEHKKITHADIRSFKQRLADYQAKAKEITREKITHPTWDKNKINKASRFFSELVAADRRNYLINLNEDDAHNLERDDWYDRIKFIREDMGSEYLKRIGYTEKP